MLGFTFNVILVSWRKFHSNINKTVVFLFFTVILKLKYKSEYDKKCKKIDPNSNTTTNINICIYYSVLYVYLSNINV